MAKVFVSATLRSFVGRNSVLDIPGQDVKTVLQTLTEEYPEAAKVIFDENGRIRPFINVYVGSESIDEKGGLYTQLGERDEVLLLPVIAGGSPRESVISDDRRKEILLDEKETERYSNHLLLREIGVKGQKRIKAAKVLVAGLGALGSPVVQYLAAAGVGTIGLADFKEVALADLQSQVAHTTRDVNRPKVASVKDKVKAINPLVKIEVHQEKLTEDNIEDVIRGYDVIVDASDNYRARYLINDACVLNGKPVVFAALFQFEGRVSVFDAKTGPCLRCMFPAPPPKGLVPTCAEGGVFSSLPGIIGSIQAGEVLKLLIGGGESLSGEMFVYDAWNVTSRKIQVHKNEKCPVCGKNPIIYQVQGYDYDELCGLKEDENEIPVESMEPQELARRLANGEKITLVDVREPHERAINRFPGTIVIPIGQLARRQNELDPKVDTVFICREGKRSILAVNTLREAGYQGPMYNLKGGMEAAKDIILPNEGAWL